MALQSVIIASPLRQERAFECANQKDKRQGNMLSSIWGDLFWQKEMKLERTSPEVDMHHWDRVLGGTKNDQWTG